jgi:siderophore synthetase component
MSAQQLRPFSMMTSNTDIYTAQACRKGLIRTLQALFHEQLLDSRDLMTNGAVSWLPLWAQKSHLRFEELTLGRTGNCQLLGDIRSYKAGFEPYTITTPSALLSCVVEALDLAVSQQDLKRLCLELENSIVNDALCLAYRQKWGQQLRLQWADYPYFLSALRATTDQNPLLILEQWGTIGHPWHPTYKTKLGLSADEVISLSPEFQADLQITVAAIKRTVVYVALKLEGSTAASELATHSDYSSWFMIHFPHVFAAWEQALVSAGLQPNEWAPLPIHPYQAERFITNEFAPEIARGDLLLLDHVAISASPTMSFRTVVPERSGSSPHMKLPVSLRLTTVERTVSPKSTVMGPRLTALLHHIIAVEGGFNNRLDIVGEEVGLHYLDPDANDDRSRHLSILYRQNPMLKRTDDLFPLPVGALFADSAFADQPLIAELVALGYGTDATAAVAFFTQYASVVLETTLSAYLLYGIAFEAHQQNSFMLVDEHDRPARLLVRDFGDVRVHAPTLQSMALTLDVYRVGHTVFEENDPVRDKILHAVMLCHLGEIALLLARTYQQPESLFWDVLREQTINVFETLKPRTAPARWASERQAFLELPWPAKAFLRMRLSDTQDDIHGQMPNPLRAR